MGRLVREIVDQEWDMFQRTQNIGGRASCQDDRETLEAYADFVNGCKEHGRNLVRENYEEMARAYGYRDLREAEEIAANRLAL